MANEIKLKRGSGSDPSASDLVVGEPAVRTDTGELFHKKDDNSVAKISGGGVTDGVKEILLSAILERLLLLMLVLSQMEILLPMQL